jgi:hypothetical protein
MTALDWDPSPRTLRQFGVIALAVLAGMAAVAHLRGRGELAQWLPLALAAVAGLLALARPTALRLVYVLLSLAVFPIGLAASHVILLVVFYGVITPLGALSRLARSDLLSLRSDPTARTFWRERRRPRDKASYLRQA